MEKTNLRVGTPFSHVKAVYDKKNKKGDKT